MVSDDSFEPTNLKLSVVKRVVIGGLILVAGIAGMIALASQKQPPAAAENGERPITVEILTAEMKDVSVNITGYGEAKALNVVSISPEVPGIIVHVHPRLETGEVIAASEVLFRIDSRNYLAGYREAEAMVAQMENAISRMRKQYAIDVQRLKTIERNRDLARAEYERIQDLLKQDNVGTRSGVDRAEQAFNSTSDQADQMDQAVSLYPIRIKEAESGLASAQARFKLAEANLQRCEIRAPFDGRIKDVSLEKGQYVSPGQQVISLADDSVLEIQVSLDSRDARRWLRFDPDTEGVRTAWFSGLEKVSVKIRWTEMKNGDHWEGYLHRVVRFDPQTRTVTVAVRIRAKNAWLPDSRALPLVEGMFCSVQIPGQTMKDVVQVPRWAVSFANTVYLVKDDRLKTQEVTVDRSEGDFAYISEGLQAGDRVITTRLIDPLENALLEITTDGSVDKES
ncbi:MAG: efflux RND transporter periplasmic adaptor subunit [Desulfobacterales bacterium]